MNVDLTAIKAFLIAGVLVPIVLHVLTPREMPWWPDTFSMAIGFGVVAVVLVYKSRTDRDINRRLWKGLKSLGRYLPRVELKK